MTRIIFRNHCSRTSPRSFDDQKRHLLECSFSAPRTKPWVHMWRVDHIGRNCAANCVGVSTTGLIETRVPNCRSLDSRALCSGFEFASNFFGGPVRHRFSVFDPVRWFEENENARFLAAAGILMAAMLSQATPSRAQACIGFPVQTNQTCINSTTLTNTSTAAGGNAGLQDAGTLTVTNTSTGSINGNTGIGFASFGIYSTGDANVTNAGTIDGTISSASSANGIFVFDNANVTNSGTIYAIAGTGGFAKGIYGSAVTVMNSGIIYGTADAGGPSSGIFANNSDANVTNSGTIYGFGGVSGTGIFGNLNANATNSGTIYGTGGVSGYGVFANNNDANIANSGTIYGITAGSDGRGVSALHNANVTNSGTISGIAGVGAFVGIGITAGNNANVTNFGTISATAGAGASAVGIRAGSGGSSIFNAGTISGGTAAIQFAGTGNTLTLAPGSAISGLVLGTGADTFQLGGTGTASFEVSQIGPAAQYQGFGAFDKVDSSVWTLTGTSTFAGPVNINGGTLAVNGDMTSASSLTVNAGGTLGGTGIVGNTTIAGGGIFAPGSGAPGSTMTVAGSLSFQSGALYLVQVSPSTASIANVSGTASLAGIVQAVLAPGSYATRSHDILHSASLNGTTFSGVSSSNPNFAVSLSYTPTDVFLNLTGATLGAGAGLNQNQQNVANAINGFFNGGGTLPPGFGTLFGLTGSNLAAALSQASGETATGTQQTTFNAMNLFMGVMTDPFIGCRSDPVSAGSAAPQFAEENDGASAYAANGNARSKSERDAYAAIYRKAPVMAAPFAPSWSVWAACYGGSQTTDGNAALGTNNTTSRIAGGVVGADYRFSPFTLAGFALAGGGTNFSIANGLGSGRSDLFQAGAFVRHTVGPAYLSAALAYGWQDITTDRTVTIAGVDQLRAQFNANAWSGRVEGGYRFVTPWMGLTPYAAGQFTTFDLPAYAEQALVGANTFALAYGSKSVTASRSELGLRTDNSWAMQDGIFTLRGRFAWAHDFNADRVIGATFQTLPGASFVVNGAAQAHDAALVTASAEKRWLNGWSAAVTFEGEFSNVTRSYAGKGVVRYSW